MSCHGIDRCIYINFNCNFSLAGKKDASLSLQKKAYDYFPGTLVRIGIRDSMSDGYVLWGESSVCGIKSISCKNSYSFARISFARIPVEVKPFQLYGKSYVSLILVKSYL